MLRSWRSARTAANDRFKCCSLAFVAPDIIEALIEGKLPRGIGITKLTDLPSSWTDQRKILGLASLASRETMPLPV